MSQRYRVALVGDYNAFVSAHPSHPLALDLASAHHHARIEATWIHTSQLENAEAALASFQGIWCVPASPFENTQGALAAIRLARERELPFLGTCGGFQHALIEYAQNVLGLASAEHAEFNPNALLPLIAPLVCSLVEREGELILEPDSLLYRSYGQSRIHEGYRCSYGPNPEYEEILFGHGLRVTARDVSGEAGCGTQRTSLLCRNLVPARAARAKRRIAAFGARIPSSGGAMPGCRIGIGQTNVPIEHVAAFANNG